MGKTPTTIREELMSLPNVLTMGRIVVIPLVLWTMLQETREWAFVAALLFSAAAVTDFLDGWIARRQGLVSLWGQFLDPVADKLIVMATTVTLVQLPMSDPYSTLHGSPKLPIWLVVLLLTREIGITSLRGMAAREGFTIHVTHSAKMKTALQLCGLIALLVGYTYEMDYLVWQGRVDFVGVGFGLLALSVLFSLTSGWAYLVSYLRCISEKQQYRTPAKRRRRFTRRARGARRRAALWRRRRREPESGPSAP